MRGHSPVFWLQSDLPPVDRTFTSGTGASKSRNQKAPRAKINFDDSALRHIAGLGDERILRGEGQT
jgi:hypothetical protein